MSLLSKAPLLLSIGFTGLAVWQLYKIRLGYASESWRKTQGLMISATIKEIVDMRHIYYSADVEYEYKVGSSRYVSRRLTYQPTRELTYERATDLLHGFVAGRACDVYYNPKSKSQSTLLRSTGWGNYKLVAAWLVVAAMCLFLHLKYPNLIRFL
jgi:Protein of unknown function (DUF3592)